MPVCSLLCTQICEIFHQNKTVPAFSHLFQYLSLKSGFSHLYCTTILIFIKQFDKGSSSNPQAQ
jgi:hypothetical protein